MKKNDRVNRMFSGLPVSRFGFRVKVFALLMAAAVSLLVSMPSSAVNLGEKKINLATEQNTVLKDVLGEIQKQTGYQVIVSDELSAIPVVGMYNDISIEDFLRRVFKKYNVSVIYDEKKQVAYVRSFGEDLKLKQTGAFHSVPRDELLKETGADSSEIDPLSGISVAELKRMQMEQLEEMERLANDPDAVDPLGEVPLADLREKQAGQLDQLKNRQNDAEAVDPQTGLSVAELQEKKARQLEMMRARENDPDAVDPQSGIPLRELREKQARQLEMLRARENDPNAPDPLMQISPSDFE